MHDNTIDIEFQTELPDHVYIFKENYENQFWYF